MECAVLCHGNTRPRTLSNDVTEYESYEYWHFTETESICRPADILDLLLM